MGSEIESTKPAPIAKVPVRPALGRDLKHLMQGDKVAGSATSVPAPEMAKGVQTLIHARALVVAQPAEAAPADATETTEQPVTRGPEPIPKWYFYVADFMLIELALLLVFGSSGQASLPTLGLALLLLTLGTILSVCAVTRQDK